jgi:hypothetical protein
VIRSFRTRSGLACRQPQLQPRSFLADQLKPFNFLNCVRFAAFFNPTGYSPERFQLIHAYVPDPTRWLELEWIDHYSGHTFRIHANRPPFPDSVKVKTNLDVLTRYRSHPDPKSLGPTGGPCGQQRIGLMKRRPVTATEIGHIGKKSNRLEKTSAGLIHDPAEILNACTDPDLDPRRTLAVPALWRVNRAETPNSPGSTAAAFNAS